jgi:hypothetical protein
MTKGGSNKVKIKLKTKTGELEKITDENNNSATEADPAEIQQIFQNQGFKYLGVVLQAETNPTCVYYYYRGVYWKICI